MELGKKKQGRPGRDYIGAVFGRLTGVGPHNHRRVKCVCSCGTEMWPTKQNLVSGATKSCGCIRRETLLERNKTLTFIHGHSRSDMGRPTKTYNSYRSMLARCYDPMHENFKNYGGRGIAVCKSWRNSFDTFLADMWERPEGHTLDRKDVNGDYCATNCKWSTEAEQKANTRAKFAKQTK